MSMRIHKFATYLRPEDAYSIVEFLDQVRDMLMQTYGNEIRTMLQEASRHNTTPTEWGNNDEPF
jgi:hypothetical protein